MIDKEYWGYTRISTPKQSLARQERNIKAEYPTATIVTEIFTGTKIYERKEWNKLYKMAKAKAAAGKKVVIIFDSVSRMSRSSEEGFLLYQELFECGVELIFLKEHHIDTETYKKAMDVNIQMTGTNADILLKAVQEYLMTLAKEQIRIAFDQAEKEVQDLHQRTKEGIETARLNGKTIGRKAGAKIHTKKEITAIEQIKKYNNSFGGSLTNEETWKLIGISKMTFYKYKNIIMEEMQKN